MQPCDVYEAVETLTFGQSLNSEAIQALSGSVGFAVIDRGCSVPKSYG